MLDVIETDTALQAEIEKRTEDFIKDSFKGPSVSDYVMINSAIKIGVLIGMNHELKELKENNDKYLEEILKSVASEGNA